MDGRLWIFYIRDEVIAEMPSRTGGTLDSMGKFAKDFPFVLTSLDY